jgi:hypothetical protein
VRRETRLLAALGAVAVIGVLALGYLAEQYKKRAHAPVVLEGGSSRAAHLVASFLAVGGVPTPTGDDLAKAGISRDDYARVRAAAVAWSSSGPVEDRDLAEAFAARGGEVRAALAR